MKICPSEHWALGKFALGEQQQTYKQAQKHEAAASKIWPAVLCSPCPISTKNASKINLREPGGRPLIPGQGICLGCRLPSRGRAAMILSHH